MFSATLMSRDEIDNKLKQCYIVMEESIKKVYTWKNKTHNTKANL